MLHEYKDIPSTDIDTLRKLQEQVAHIAQDPVHKERAELWRRLNDLESTRPMLWMMEFPLNEIDEDPELALTCQHEKARFTEICIRRQLYHLKHYPGDTVVNDFIGSPICFSSTGFGIVEDVDIVRTEESSSVVSREFHRQIVDPEDLDKIKMPVVTYDAEATEAAYEYQCAIFGDIMPVKKIKHMHTWYTPWDNLIRWWGVEEAMLDLVMKPDLVHAAVEKMVDAYLAELDQLEQMNLLATNCTNCRIGSGGYGYTNALPGDDYDPQYVRPHNMWGCANAQIFSAVSPEMHWEFAVKHDMRWLERWGMTYYGCCEPLDLKMDVLRRIPNLRKISISPWCDLERAAAEIGTDYVISHKPNPAILAEDRWRPEQARKEIADALDKLAGCHVEIILKDISTCRHDPKRLWEWETIAMEEIFKRYPD